MFTEDIKTYIVPSPLFWCSDGNHWTRHATDLCIPRNRSCRPAETWRDPGSLAFSLRITFMSLFRSTVLPITWPWWSWTLDPYRAGSRRVGKRVVTGNWLSSRFFFLGCGKEKEKKKLLYKNGHREVTQDTLTLSKIPMSFACRAFNIILLY